ncbi:MAG: 3-isopropylmalate dehydrogenase [Desulfarculaceae bacterium]|nr:3-isopropylmalate dehydrogenase [Desulfarculaceae bacterium]MCF8047171.1 3-isopropylmalate dehydrogenase [Desulfarculaceae bacterium]MCF8064324.1 3-isopropylmalate dehydrogenase [Desulfarculaceae bacterium]MCF8096754.1 3-isopropylmalate dehydrogenase [Desulfarculaceae bacterium]MCF8121453.1 3-isopropylmalate dehydrogenase [Desulfarculaceae bacterium]
MKTYSIANIPGDGVGAEIALEAVKILAAAGDKFGFACKVESYDWGCDYYLKHGEMGPKDKLTTLKDFDAIFLGCIGDAAKVPDHVSLTILLDIRKGFDQYVNLRPIKLYPGVYSPIRTATPESVDFMVVRENTEGEYAGTGGYFKPEEPEGFAYQTAIFSRKGCDRVIRYAFELARSRKGRIEGDHVGMLTNCTKSNALNYSMVYWDKIYREVAADFPDIKQDMALVDAMTMWMVKNPEYFDVVVASNLFGDIITDLGAMLQGGMGFAAGGNINPEKDFPSMFEPIHGSAPKYAGKGVVNPIATIESVRMMLDHLGESEAAQAVQDAEIKVLEEGAVRTKDMGGTATTAQMGDAVKEALLA